MAACMPGNFACRRLSAELERVQRDGGVRQSGVWTEVSPVELGDRAEIVIVREQEGDFQYYYDLFATRACLGPGWSEVRYQAIAPGWSGSHRRSRVVVEAGSP